MAMTGSPARSALLVTIVLLCCIAHGFRTQALQYASQRSRFITCLNGINKDGFKRGPAQNDWISRFVSAFLPTPEDIGLSRYDSNTRPENYPATKTEWAEAMPEDTSTDLRLIRPVLAKTNLERRPLKLVYDANRDGWKAKIFHEKVDKLGPAIVLARSQSGGIFGGYNPTGWVNYGELRGSIAAFLYTFPDGNTNDRPIKLQKISGAGLAQVDDGSGPKFGPEGLTIALERGREKLVRCKLGPYYERMPGEGKSLLPGGAPNDTLIELKVFVGVWEEGERIPYSDAMPFSLN